MSGVVRTWVKVQVRQRIDKPKRTVSNQRFLFLDIDSDEFHVSGLGNIDRRFGVSKFPSTKDFPREIQLIEHIGDKRFAFQSFSHLNRYRRFAFYGTWFHPMV